MARFRRTSAPIWGREHGEFTKPLSKEFESASAVSKGCWQLKMSECLAVQHTKRSMAEKWGESGRKGLNNSPDLNAKSDGGVEFFAEPKTSRGEQQNVDSVQSIIPAPRALGERRVNPSRRPSLSLSLSPSSPFRLATILPMKMMMTMPTNFKWIKTPRTRLPKLHTRTKSGTIKPFEFCLS